MSSTLANGGQVIVRRSSRWMWVLLILSLSINLLIIGITLGSLWAIRNGGYWNAPVAVERSIRFMSGLPKARREEIRAIFFEYKPRLAPYWGEVRQARIKIGGLIKSGSYSKEQLDAAMDEMFRKELAAREAAKPMIAEMVGKLNPRERIRFLSVFVPYLDEVQGQPPGKASP
ncbi:MAG: periplasmic heavy metal sensor [Rhodomicrobiaceae bacterium]